MPLSELFFSHIIIIKPVCITYRNVDVKRKKQGNKSEQRKGKKSDSSESKDWVGLTPLTTE